ncbi:MAG: hypothetical protein AB1553_11360 [Nitrospirota bacterium]
MKIHGELIIGVLLTAASAYYWAAIGNSSPVETVPVLYRYTFRLYPYLDVAFTAVGMLVFYRGLKKLKE